MFQQNISSTNASSFAFETLLKRDFTPRAFSDMAGEFYRATLAMMDMLLGMLDVGGRESRSHFYRVTCLALAIGKKMELDSHELFELGTGSLLHDIGEILVSKDILLKKGPLTEEERNAIRHHPEFGGVLLDRFPPLDFAKPVVVQHHERWDGSGYPKGLRMRAIRRSARIFAVADTFDAMTENDYYKPSAPVECALAELTGLSGFLYDPEAVEALVDLLGAGYATPSGPGTPEDILEGIFAPEHFLDLFVPHKRRTGF